MKLQSGMRVGHLTLIERDSRGCDVELWIVKCDCGREKVLHKRDLRPGRNRTCGNRCPFRGSNQRQDTLKRIERHTEIVGDCWIYKGTNETPSLTQSRHGKQSTLSVKQFMFNKFRGHVANGKQVESTCGNRRCINPSHLRICPYGYAVARGENKGNAKLTCESVKAIRQKHKTGLSQTQLSKDYGVSVSTIQAVLEYRTWKHVEDPTYRKQPPLEEGGVM